MEDTNKKPKLSIITTFYNAEAYIYGALTSVNQQVHGDYDWEYIIVDDKSEDKSRQILEDFISNNVNDEFKQNWKIIEPPENLGCGGARKFGINHSAGDYLMFLDADDYYIHTDFCKRAMNDIQSTKADIVEYGIIFNTANGDRSYVVSNQQLVIENNTEAALLYLYKDNIIKFNVWTKIYTRDIVNSFEYSDTRMFEDVRTIPMWIYNANKIVVMPTCEINYRAAANSIIREDNIKTRIGTITAITELFPVFKQWDSVLKAMYQRSMIDFSAVLEGHTSREYGFNEMAELNKKQLSYIFPKDYEQFTATIDDINVKDESEIEIDSKVFNKETEHTPID